MTQTIPWHKVIPIEQHAIFLCAERAYCRGEEEAFYEAQKTNADDIEERRKVVLNKREEYLLYYLENELERFNKKD
jgi:hypothetical protein